MDLSMRLKLARERAGLSQKDLARISGCGEKSISSFETSQRIHAIKVSQLTAIIVACGFADLVAFLTWEPGPDDTHAPLVRVPSAVEPPAPLVRRRPVDPLAGRLVSADSPYPSPQSSLGGAPCLR